MYLLATVNFYNCKDLIRGKTMPSLMKKDHLKIIPSSVAFKWDKGLYLKKLIFSTILKVPINTLHLIYKNGLDYSIEQINEA